MDYSFILKMFAGVGMFLFAISLIEDALKQSAGRMFKLLMKKYTRRNVTAILSGVIVTGILQSSSMVSLIMLAFVGAGILTTGNALAVVLGANVGTTISNWLVVAFGFKVNIEPFCYPAVGLAGLGLVLFANHHKLKNFLHVLMGVGLLFIGIGWIKSGAEEQVMQFDLSKYTGYSLFTYLIFGFILTSFIQSSSATMAIALSALNAGLIALPVAVSVVIGAEVGTTIKIVLGSARGSAAKKRLALGNFLFNIFTAILSFIFLEQILNLLSGIFRLHDALITLVAFQSFINIVSLILLFPFLGLFAKFLERRFKSSEVSAAAYINHASIKEGDSAIDLFRKEVGYFVNNAMLFNLEAFEKHNSGFRQAEEYAAINRKKKFSSRSFFEKYEWLKELQGELHSFYIKLHTVKLTEQQSLQLDQLISAARSTMHAAKSVKDVSRNISDLERSSKNIKYQFYLRLGTEMEKLYDHLNELMQTRDVVVFGKLQELLKDLQHNYTITLKEFYADTEKTSLPDLDITTTLNFHRELFGSHKAMLMAIKDLTLDSKQAHEFNEIPMYLT